MLEGGSLRDDPKEWLTNAILLTTGHRTKDGMKLDEYWPPSPRTAYPFHLGPDPPEEGQRSVLRLDARSRGTASFALLESGERVDVMRVAILPRKPAPDHGAPLYLPVHCLCLQLADRLIDSVETSLLMTQVIPLDGITSDKNLWEVLHRRLCGNTAGTRTWALPEPHEYFGGRRCRNIDWEPGDDPEHAKLHEQNPVEILGLTESILQNLEPAASVNSSGVEREYATRQDWYCEALVNQQIFPWLWDLDSNAVREKQHAGHWNWELLVRQVSLKQIHEPDDISIDLPLQLRNRRRIWRLLEEAKIQDVAGLEERLMAARMDERRRYALAAAPSSLPAGFNPQGVPSFSPPSGQ